MYLSKIIDSTNGKMLRAVSRTFCFVEHDQRRAFEQHAGEAKQLLFTAAGKLGVIFVTNRALAADIKCSDDGVVVEEGWARPAQAGAIADLAA